MGGRVKRPDIARYAPPLVAGLAAACVIGLIHLALPTYLKELDLQISDRMHQLRLQVYGPLRQDPRLIHVNVDDSSVSVLGRVPWPRDLVAQVVDTARDLGAHAVVFDVLFPFPTSPKIDPKNENDRAFAQALSAIGRSYIASALDLTKTLETEGQQEAEDLKREMVYPTELLRRHTAPAPIHPPMALYYGKTRFLPLEAFGQVAGGIGHISRSADSDGGVRRNPLVVQVKDRLFPALSFRVAVDLLGSDLSKVALEPGAVIVRDALVPGEAARKDLRIPVDRQGQMTVSFANEWDQAFMHISAAELLEEAEDPEKRPELEKKFKDAVVLYAVSTTGTSDTGTVPLESAYPLNGVHMNMINTILTQQFLVESGPYTVLYLVLGMAIGVALLSLWLQPYIYLIVAIATISGYVALAWAGFNEFGRILPVAPVVLVGVISSAGMLTYRYAAGEREKQKTRAAFAPYFAPAVVEMLLSDATRLMGGQRKELTILFSDIVSFTTLCEGIEPEVVQKVLQEYFNEMTRIGFGHHGTLDKFIGDGMLWFFGDPLPQEDHALRAVHTALDMQAAMHPLREKWKQEGRPELAMRVGVNTGVVLVGNMGSDARMEYTVMGDAVNLASRVEGANKPFHTEVMMTERTFELTKDIVEWRELDLLRVKGKKQGVRVYEVMAARKGELSELKQQVRKAYNEGLSAYQRRDWAAASAAFIRALEIDKTDGPSQLYLGRAQEFLTNPPPADWDGVYEMETK